MKLQISPGSNISQSGTAADSAAANATSLTIVSVIEAKIRLGPSPVFSISKV